MPAHKRRVERDEAIARIKYVKAKKKPKSRAKYFREYNKTREVNSKGVLNLRDFPPELKEAFEKKCKEEGVSMRTKLITLARREIRRYQRENKT